MQNCFTRYEIDSLMQKWNKTRLELLLFICCVFEFNFDFFDSLSQSDIDVDEFIRFEVGAVFDWLPTQNLMKRYIRCLNAVWT